MITMKKHGIIFMAAILALTVSAAALTGCGEPSDGAQSAAASTVSGGNAQSSTEAPSTDNGGSQSQNNEYSDFEYEKTNYYYNEEEMLSYECIRLLRYKGSAAKVTIPDKIEDLPVSILGDNLFADSAVEEIEIPGSVVSIEYSCMKNCANLKSIKLPKDLKYLGSTVFQNCTSLASVELPEGLEEIDSEAFKGCTALQEITIPESVKKINSWAFYDCNALEKFSFPSKLEFLGGDVLYNTKLINDAPEGEIYIGNVFYSYKFNTDYRDKNHESVMKFAQQGKFTFREDTRVIADDAFYNESSKDGIPFVDFEIPASVVYASSCFYNMNIGTINISAQIAKTSSTMFDMCQVNNIVFDEDVTELGESFFGNTDMEVVEVPATVKTIGASCFSASRIKTIFIHEGAETIGQLAFRGNPELEKVYIPSTVKSFGEGYTHCFDECPKLTVYTTAGSEAEKYAKEHSVPVQIIAGEEEFKV